MKQFFRGCTIAMLLAVVVAAVALLCGCTPTPDPTPAHTHTWVEGDTTPPTCDVAGNKHYTCACGESKDEAIPATDHSWDDGVVKAPTCTKEGTITYTCANCSRTRYETTPATGHTFADVWSHDDSFHYYAATCGCEDVKDKAYHNFDENDTCTICAYHTDIPVSERSLAYGERSNYCWVTGRGNVIGDTIVIPATHNGKEVRYVDANAFFNDAFITTLIVEDGVREIRSNAFNGCSSLEVVRLGDSVSISDKSFLNTIVTSATGNAAAMALLPHNCLADVTVTSGDALPDGAFRDAKKLTVLTLPASIKTVGAGVFNGCAALKSVVYDGTIDDWMQIDFSSTPLGGGVTIRFNNGKVLEIPEAIVGLENVAGDTFLEIPDSIKLNGTYDKNTDYPAFFPALSKIIEHGRNDVPIYGIYCYTGDYGAYQAALQDIGFLCVRTNSTAVSDLQFGRLAEDGISMMATLGISVMEYVPQEVKDAGNVATWLTQQLSTWKKNPENSELNAWFERNVNHALNYLRRYGPNGSFFAENPDINYNPVLAVETFNEPNFGYMISGLENNAKIKQNLYATLHMLVYDAVHAEFGDQVKVVAFGCGGEGWDVPFITDTLNGNSGMLGKMDVVSTHPYQVAVSPFVSKIPSSISKIRDVVGEDRPIWITEGGYQIPSSEGGQYDYGKPSNAGFSTQMDQAAFLVQQYILGMRIGIERIMYMYLIDTDNCNYGVINLNGTYRKSAYSIRTIIDMMPDPLIKEAIMEGKDADGKLNHAYVYVFESEEGGHDVTVAFSAQDALTIDIPWEDDYALVTDLFGCSRLVKVEDGVLTLRVGGYIQYITHVELTDAPVVTE